MFTNWVDITHLLFAHKTFYRTSIALVEARMAARVAPLAILAAGKFGMTIRTSLGGFDSMTKCLTGMPAISPGFADLDASSIRTLLKIIQSFN